MTNALLYTLPQWFIFAALLGIIYGWIENKKVFRLVGLILFILLGFLSVYILKSGQLAPNSIEIPQNAEIPDIQKRLFPAYLIFIISALLALISFLFDWKNKKQARLFIVITGIVEVVGFFIVVGVTRAF